MSANVAIDAKSTALLLIDLQNFIFQGYLPAASAPAVLERTKFLLAAARESGMLVVHVVVSYRPSHLEVSPRNKVFGALRAGRGLPAGSPQVEIHPQVAPSGDEPVVVKHRVGAFAGTDLETILRSSDIKTIMLAGIATSGAILSTVRYAFDIDYGIIVAKDCCADRDENVHRALMDVVFEQQAEVLTADQIVGALRNGR